ncbi:MAG: hypothetical protein KTR19_04780 [Hyphomicrobiales bacterium]|nr:hypothetical protein [Hyphomicrobiales bacterium]
MDQGSQTSRFTKGTVIVAILGLMFTAAQLWESNRQSRTQAAIAFITLHNNERLYDARKQLFDLEAEIVSRLRNDRIDVQGLPQQTIERVLRDYRLAQLHSNAVSGTDNDDLFDFRGMSLVQLYDATARCMERGLCKYDITDHHFRDMARKVLASYRAVIPTWRVIYDINDLGVDACRLAEGEIEDTNLIESSLEVFQSSIVDNSNAQDNSPGCQLLEKQSRRTS